MSGSKYASVLKAVQEAPHANRKFDATIIGIFEVRNQIALLNVPVEYVVLSENVWKFLAYKDEDFPKVVEPVTEEDLKGGVECLVYGMTCLVDSTLPGNTIGVYSSFPGPIAERVFRCTMVPR